MSESGDIGICFSATPFLDYFGNMFNGNLQNSSPSATFANSYQAIEIKKLKDSNTAYRGKLRIGFGSSTDKELVTDANDPDGTVEDKTKMSNFNVVLGAGLEKRVGSSRVVGVYGAEAYIMFGTSKTKYEYGNDIEDVPETFRTLEEKDGSTFGLGAGVFGGVEWFFAPKMSLGAEYTWGLMFASTGNGETVTEIEGDSDDTSETGGNSSFGIDTGVSGADIKFTFYFQ